MNGRLYVPESVYVQTLLEEDKEKLEVIINTIPLKCLEGGWGRVAEGDGKTKVTGRVGRECVSLQ